MRLDPDQLPILPAGTARLKAWMASNDPAAVILASTLLPLARCVLSRYALRLPERDHLHGRLFLELMFTYYPLPRVALDVARCARQDWDRLLEPEAGHDEEQAQLRDAGQCRGLAHDGRVVLQRCASAVTLAPLAGVEGEHSALFSTTTTCCTSGFFRMAVRIMPSP